MLPNRSAPDVQKKRAEWTAGVPELCSESFGSLVFLDECGININMTRRYGRAVGQQRVIDSAPVNTPASTTVVCAMTADGPLAWDMWSGGTTKDRFAAYVRNELAPSLAPGSIVIMDNLTAHHSREVQDILHEHGVEVLYLPPYSPDLNPVEELWSKMKTILRKWRIRVRDVLRLAADDILQRMISAKDCTGWFRHDGYVPPGQPA